MTEKPKKRLPPMPKLPPPKYGDSLGKRAGGWLYGLLTAWKR